MSLTMDPVSHEVTRHLSLLPNSPSIMGSNSCGRAYTLGGANQFGSDMPKDGTESHSDQLKTNLTVVPQNETSASYELSPNRRKRRKTSHEPDPIPHQTLEHEVQEETSSVEVSDRGRSNDLKSEEPVQTTIAPQKDVQEHRPAPEPPSSASLPKKRGRPPKSAALTSPSKILDPTPKQNNGQSDLRASPRKTASTTQKETMRLTSDGKLFGLLRPSQSEASCKDLDTKPPTKIGHGKSLTLKNGKLAQNLIAVLRYEVSPKEGNTIGAKIEQILSGHIRLQRSHSQAKPGSVNTQVNSATKSTHPFFLAKASQQQTALPALTTPDTNKPRPEAPKPVAWKDLTFKSNQVMKATKSIVSEKPLWPPLAYHHVGIPERRIAFPKNQRHAAGKNKSKLRMEAITEAESILSSEFLRNVGKTHASLDLSPPEKVRGTAAHVLGQFLAPKILQNNIRAVSSARDKMLHARSAFDRAESSGPYPWTQQYGPTMWEEVLQSTSHILFEWLSCLVIHNVKQGLDPKQPKLPIKRRKRPKRRNDEFADFIDFEDDDQATIKTKNAILLVGPNGCGKTASVFAVAKQLGFEVFEIHPGMRRSQKDIFEKVGDMTQNHMVQRGQNSSRDSSVLPEVDPTSSQEEGSQPSLTSFLAPPHKKGLLAPSRSATPQPSKQTQKQSLILIEEVDHVFEDDRGFWSGIQALIQNSKRPVVLTCNDVSSVPLDELDLFDTLIYTAPPTDIVVEYLCYIAAAEGHIIEPKAIYSLYESKGQDLRATMTELQFWCQMAVGSIQGGLDWFPPHKSRSLDENEAARRTFSKDTFRAGLDLSPSTFLSLEQELRFANETLDISYDSLLRLSMTEKLEFCSLSQTSEQTLQFLEARSDAERIDPGLQPLIYSTIAAATPLVTKSINRSNILQAKMDTIAAERHKVHIDYNCLNALSVENSIHSLGHSRPAASLDSPRSILACDIAPYIRTVVSYDLELERQRNETFSSQGKKSRTTRAARAAAEGGDKANTRRERWFTGGLDVYAVLRTGNRWPQWSESQSPVLEHIDTEHVSSI